jgi:hypothetical protein
MSPKMNRKIPGTGNGSIANYMEIIGPAPPAAAKKIDNRIDRARWNREAQKEEPQCVNHRHWGLWEWW